MNYRLGKHPATPHYGLKLSDYVRHSDLPSLPEEFGHGNLVSDWGMLGNDTVGDCAIAGPFHAEMLWCTEGDKPFKINTECTLEMYSAITGYDPSAYNWWTNSNPTDNGSNVQDVAEYWRTTGLKDAAGNIHKIQCYMALEPGNVEQLFQAIYLFGAVGIGVELPAEFQDAFNRGEVWDALEDPHIEGGHYILGVGKRAGNIEIVTWGQTCQLTPAAYEQFNDETFVYFNEEMLVKGKSLEGFDADQLMADLADIHNETGGEDPAPQLCGK
ncbi:hypothetical protein DQP57_00420 [Mycobacterium colombiense]|uniref:Uncharacterized protein n=1 Tax=Mycobacterium colombiense TaxID=339268 RepID=A0A329MFT2_9MYCO|nr:hypothetical protein [Mycobacterium colombiense]RAV17523.1 hypothetical protein DQP57_00420 [Mycobacterium colombiense]